MFSSTISQIAREGCPLSAFRAWSPCLEAAAHLSFAVEGFPAWRVRFLNGPETIRRFAPEVAGNAWMDKELITYLAESPQGVDAGLLVLEHASGDRLLVSTQTFTFNAANQVRQDENDVGVLGIRRWLSRFFSFPVLTLGQFLVSGTDGMQEISLRPELKAQLPELLDQTARQLTRKIGGYYAILVKDLYPLDDERAVRLAKMGYYQLPVDPSMQLTVRPHWESMEDYLRDVTSKYRVRYRRARKQLGDKLTVRELSVAEVEHYGERLHELYLGIKSEAAFDAISLSPDYFFDIKSRYPDTFRLTAYFEEEALIGFRTTLANGETLHAHYLGFDQAFNRARHLYHNILFDLLEEAIDGRFESLDYGRTALEIKSSVGAVPIDYFCGLRGSNPVIRWVIRNFTPAVFKPTKWTQRRPYKW